MYLNNSSAETFEDCPRKFYWQREYLGLGGPGGIEPQYTNEALLFGQLVHGGLAYLYAGDHVVNAAEKAIADSRRDMNFDELDYEEQNKWEANYEWFTRILQAYDEWRSEEDDFQPFQIEAEGCVVLGEECYRCGAEYPHVASPSELLVCPTCGAEVHHWVFRTDLVLSDGNYVEVLDHKTTKSASDLYIASWDTSMQMWGYCYGYSKATGMDVTGYRMNIIRKLKSIGTPAQTLKQCPSCRNGSKKKVGCETCGGEGKVERENNPSDQPFQRPETYDYNDERRERFVRQRINTIQRIMAERERFKEEPDAAFPCNPKACYSYGKCPFIKLCYEGDPERWYEPNDQQLDRFVAKGEDYVSVRQLAREEAR
jgi:hypothetical protein